MTAENLPGGGFSTDRGQNTNATEKPGLRVLVIYRGPDTFVASRPGYFRRISSQSNIAGASSMDQKASHDSETSKK